MTGKRMQSEVRDDYYRRLNYAEERGIRKGIEKGLGRAMESFQVDLERACEGLGTTVGVYRAAKELLE